MAVKINGEIISSSNENSASVSFKITDNAGNISSVSKSFSIDKNAPEIMVSYIGDAFNNIYKTERTAVIRIKERNFDEGKININVDGNQEGVYINRWTLAEGIAGTDSAIYQTTVVFSGNGRYVLSVSGTDICGNKAQTYTSESFLIDRTSPVVEIISDGQEKVNGWYYSSGRTLTIKITEDNFDASRINIKGADNRISEWKTNGNVHTAVVKFEDDGEYEFSVSGSDKAGNNFSEYNESFCIDTKATDIIFDGVKDKSANKGDVSLKILFEDKNHSPENISVSITGAQRGKIEISDDLFTKTDNGTMFMYNDFPFEKIYDDVYTVTAKAEDKAGNISEKTIIFSVNRFGSNYVFDEKALLIAGTYINNPVDILIHEINVDKLQNGKSIVLVKDSENITLSEGKDYTVNVSGGDGMWYDYEYIISSKCFSDDAAYIIIISSEDEAGNQNTTADKNKEAELKFGVDKTKPRCIPVNIESNHSYRADFMKVNFIVEDNILINEVNVYINGQTQKTEITNDGKNYYFTIESSDKPQNIIIKVSDMAGNETETIIENVLISPSLARVLVHKTWIKIVGTVSATGTVGGLLFWLKRRRI